MPRHSPFRIQLTREERCALEARARKYTSPYRDVIRAKIVLLAAEGFGNDLIAARLDTPRQIVSKWRHRFFEERMPGLEETPRGGRTARFSPQASSSTLNGWRASCPVAPTCHWRASRSLSCIARSSPAASWPRSAASPCGGG